MHAGVDRERLRRWMDAQGLGRGELSVAVELGGGTQNILLRFTRDGRDYVLRRPSLHPRPDGGETMRREARVLAALGATAVPHPRLIASCDDEQVLGCAFYLMEPVDGFNPLNGLPALHEASAAMRRRMGFALVEGCAALGALDHASLGLAGFGRPDGFLERQVARWSAQLASYTAIAGWPGAAGLPAVDAVGVWLQQNLPARFAPGLMHGDYHFGNVLYRHDDAELAAIVDWEMATIGDPLLDLGWLLATWPAADESLPWRGLPQPEELVAHYRERSRRDLAHIDWYAVLACYKLAIVLEGTHARACAGKAPRATGELLHERACVLLRRALDWIG